jgi:hypothetical protein
MPVPKGTRIGGRQKGTRNKRTEETVQRMKDAAVALDGILPESFKGDAHAFLMAVYKNETNTLKDRLAAATAAIGYEKPKLGSVDVKAEVDATVEVSRIELVAPSIASDDHAAH